MSCRHQSADPLFDFLYGRIVLLSVSILVVGNLCAFFVSHVCDCEYFSLVREFFPNQILPRFLDIRLADGPSDSIICSSWKGAFIEHNVSPVYDLSRAKVVEFESVVVVEGGGAHVDALFSLGVEFEPLVLFYVAHSLAFKNSLSLGTKPGFIVSLSKYLAVRVLSQGVQARLS